MDEKQFNQLLGVLKNISQNLSVLVSLQKSSTKPAKLGAEEKIILKLCNGKNSINDMTKIANKTTNNVKVTLTHLRKKGLIKTVKINKKTGYVKI